MKSILSRLLHRMPLSRIWIAGAGAGLAGSMYAWLAGEGWYIPLLTALGGMLIQALELVWTYHKAYSRIKAVRKARHKAQVVK